MFESIHIGLTGLETYSKGLNVISNNVANLNTTGYKGSQLQFADLYYREGEAGLGHDEAREQIGTGVGTAGTSVNFQQGEARKTGNDLDVLVDGAGFFVLRQDGATRYTRAGQFEFDKEGFLVDKLSGARVAGLDDSGQLQDLSITGLRASPPHATTSVKFSGNLSTAATQHVIPSVSLFDATGAATAVKLTFDNTNTTTRGSWKVTATDAKGKEVGSGELRFDKGAPQPGFDSIALSVTSEKGEEVKATLDFTVDTTSFSAGTTSTLAVVSQDGYGAGSLVKSSFDAEGSFVTTYSNGQTEKHGRLALASFANLDALEQVGNTSFVQRFGEPPELGRPGEQVFGKVTAGSIEASNVDLSQQFSEMIITQRGYQAASQVITTANEMIQQLMDLRGKR
jgi:flagellar hook protein FlgE